ncbi:MAG: succinyldiaminopimelate aminotransferase [Planctomycetaceae bacterium]|nr:succinyldiaminopimelate aminotransferase [Planctomycetaceae bacterium]
MMKLDELLRRLWDDFVILNPHALRVHELVLARGERIHNDHIAFRTFDDPRLGIDVLARAFVEAGYEAKDEYDFAAKKLLARHYEHAESALPKVFVSELKVGEFGAAFGQRVAALVDQIPAGTTGRDDFPVTGRPWDVSYDDYEALRVESEYGAWLAAFGFRANHFTIDVGQLSTFDGLAAFNGFLNDNGMMLNGDGGEIKGSAEDFLEQSSTLAEPIEVEFTDGAHAIPGCYYEFAQRYTLPDGSLFTGFVARSADRIFQSTDQR